MPIVGCKSVYIFADEVLSGYVYIAISERYPRRSWMPGEDYLCIYKHRDVIKWRREVSVFSVRKIFTGRQPNWDIIRIYAEPFVYSAASCRALEKVGFQYEGGNRWINGLLLIG